MSSSRDLPHLKIRGVEESLGLIPHLLGFHPHESLVVVVIVNGRVEVTARVDLAPLCESGSLRHLLDRLWGRFPGADGWFVAYSADASTAWRVLAECRALVAGSARCRVVHVDGGSWWADSPHTEPGRHDPAASSLAAEATVLGLQARPSREDLASLVRGPGDDEIDGLVEVFEREHRLLSTVPGPDWPDLMTRALRELRGDSDLPTDGQCARLAILAQHPDARDRALLAITSSTADRQVALWASVVRRCLLPFQAMPLGLLGMAAWVSGDGALQVVCLERAEILAPGCALVSILGQINEQVLPPAHWDQLRSTLLAEVRSPKPRAVSRRSGRRDR